MPAQKLIIVESPTKAGTLTKFLASSYKVMATMGHIRDLPKSKLGVDVSHQFKPDYVWLDKKKPIIQALKKEAKTAARIILATDPDREGEAIAWHVAALLQKLKKPIVRISFHEITKSAIKQALAHPGVINKPLVDAQQARRVLDRLVGYKLSPLLWRKIRRGLSAGRVQSVAVRLIVDREREIEKFKPQEYWEIWVELKKLVGHRPPFSAKLSKINSKKAVLKNQSQVSPITAELKNAAYQIVRVERKKITQTPPPPFKTSTLQQKAVQALHFSGKRTMRAAQSLYEKGLITYHRTDSVNLASQAMDQIRKYIADAYGPKYLPPKPRFYKTKSKVAQEAHEAIRPTNVRQISDLKTQVSNRDEQRLYEIIFRRTVACQMAAAVWNKTKISIKAKPAVGGKNIYQFLAEGKTMKFPGWMAIYKKHQPQQTNGNEKELPELKENEKLDLVKLNPQQKFTQPLPRYTEATLVKALEQQDIGRPSTYAPIISTIQTRQYVEKQEGKFHPTALGVTVNDFLMKYFPNIFDYQFTAKMENDLDDIARGEGKWVPVIKEFYQPFAKTLENITAKAKRVQVPVEKIGKECPECKKKGLPRRKRGQLVIRIGRFGKFIACSRFPECKYTAPFVAKLEGVKCPQCGSDIVIKKSKKGRQFYGCSNYPKCKWASWRKPK